MKRLELRKTTKASRIKKRPHLKAKRRVSVSEAKAHLSAVLKQVQDGQSIIVTDHGKDIARIEGIQDASQLNQLRMTPAQRPFSEVKDVRAPIPTGPGSDRSMLELLKEDRDNR